MIVTNIVVKEEYVYNVSIFSTTNKKMLKTSVLLMFLAPQHRWL